MSNPGQFSDVMLVTEVYGAGEVQIRLNESSGYVGALSMPIASAMLVSSLCSQLNVELVKSIIK